MKLLDYLGAIAGIAILVGAVLYIAGLLFGNDILAYIGAGISAASYYLGCICIGLPVALAIIFGIK